MTNWVEITEADIATLTAPTGTNTWTPKAGCPNTQVRTFNAGKYAGVGPRVYAEITAADGVLYWALFIDDAPRRRGGLDARCIARGQYARSAFDSSITHIVKARIERLAMAHVREQLDRAIVRTIEALAVSVAEHEGIGKAAADLDLADARAVVAWDRENTRAAEAADREAARLAHLLALTNA